MPALSGDDALPRDTARAMSQENVEAVRRLYDLWDRRAFALAVELYDPDIVYARIGDDVPDFAGRWRGVEQMRQAVMPYLSAFVEYRFELEEIRDLGDRVLVRERHRAFGRRSGVAVDHAVGALFTLREGRVVELVQYWHFADALEAAGLGPRAGRPRALDRAPARLSRSSYVRLAYRDRC